MFKNYVSKFSRFFLLSLGAIFVGFFSFPLRAQTGKPPIIIIPGITGSELVNRKTGKVVWFSARRAKDDDLRLPISSPILAKNRDNLVAGDILRGVKLAGFLPETEIYGKLIESLETREGYKEGTWNKPPAKGYEDTFYVFAYDWRRDNVENARLLVKKVTALKRKLKRPNLKFTVIAHSMGGLISRYAAMYGDADIPSGKLKPTWRGTAHFGKIFLLGTPNEGSILSLNSLIHGYALGGIKINIPFVMNLSRFDLFTLPGLFQLLPHDGTLKAYDENLQPLEIDVYDIKTWEKYGWSAIGDKDFTKKFKIAEQRNARNYFSKVLNRAKRFQEALNANTNATTPIQMFILGGDCKETLNAIVIYRDKDEWKTLFKPDSFKKSTGEKVTEEELKTLMYANGDGVVTKRSLLVETLRQKTVFTSILPVSSELFLCEDHTKLVTNQEIQDKLFSLLTTLPK